MRLVLTLLCISSIAFASDDHLVGWSTDGTFYAIYGDTCADPVVELCPVKGAKPTWPAKYGTPDGDSCIASYENQDLLALDEASLAKLAPVKGGAAPSGATVKVTANGDKATVTVSKGGQTQTFTMDDAAGAKLDKAIWRPDGKQVAVRVATKNHETCREEIDHQVSVFDLTFPANAKDLNVAGMKALKAKDYAAATKAFQDAIKADSTYLLAYYNLASVTSIAGDLKTSQWAIEYLFTAKGAAKMIAQSKTDPDLDFASTDPQVRTVMGVGPYPTDATKRLTERDAVWSSEGPCEGQTDATIQLQFKKAGKLVVTAFCKGEKGAVNTEKWTADKLTLEQAPLLGDADQLEWIKCPGSDVAGSCFKVGDRTFHRGVPHGN